MTAANIYLISPALNDWQVSVQIEEISKNIQEKKEVEILYCNFLNGNCSSNLFGSKIVCKTCRNNALTIARNFFPDINIISLNQDESEDYSGDLSDELFFNSAISTLNSNLRPVKDNWTRRQRYVLQSVQLFGRKFYASLVNNLSSKKINRINFYNGRVFPSAILLEYAKEHKIKYSTFEINSIGNEYYIFNEHTPHDINYGRIKVNSFIKDNYSFEELNTAKQFFKKNIDQHRPKKFINISLKIQKKFNEEIISIFTSSDDELSSLGKDWESDFTKSIPNTITKILLNFPYIFFIVRVHPNQNGQGSKIFKIYSDIASKFENILVIFPTDNFSSYSIIEKSKAVISFGSTISVEASYMGKVSILLGNHFFDNSGVVHKAVNWESAFNLIENYKNLAISNSKAPIAYALFCSRSGIVFEKIQGITGKYTYKLIPILQPYPIIYLITKLVIQFRYARKDIFSRKIFRLIFIKTGLYDLKKDRLGGL
jgi:hypothetical protein